MYHVLNTISFLCAKSTGDAVKAFVHYNKTTLNTLSYKNVY